MPHLGATVIYQLASYDVDQISKQREGQPRTFNDARETCRYPAIVVATWGGTQVNLQVFLDGNDTYWATSRQLGDEPGSWAWPSSDY